MIRYRWRTELKAATTEEAVLDLVNEYLQEWKPEEIESLPPETWPKKIRTWKEVTTWTFKLGEVHSRFAERNSHALARLQELLLFFTHASVRITQVRSAAGDHAPEALPSGAATEEGENHFRAPPKKAESKPLGND